MAGMMGASPGERAPASFSGQVNMAFVAGIVAVATIGGLMFGYDSGVINGTQNGLRAGFQLDDFWLGVVVAAILPGCAVGAFAAGRLADLLGRRTVMIISAVLFVLSALLAGAAPDKYVFILARLVGGLGVGAASVLCPLYISEVTPASMRGRLSSLQQIMIIAGLTAAFLVNYFLARWAGESTAVVYGHPAWRWMFWMQTVPAIVFLVSLLTIPESPRFLVVKGRKDQAAAVLTRLFGAEEANRKVAEISDTLAKDHHKPRFSDLIDRSKGRVRPIVWAGIGIAIFQQLVGINIVFYYGAELWQSVGFTEKQSLQTNIGSGVVSIVACLAAIAVIDKIGRKPLLLIGSAGMAVTLALMAYAFSQGSIVGGHLHLPNGIGVLALISANLYVIFFNGSWGPVMWVMLGEMFPNQIRGSALAVAGFAQWAANFAISVSFPSMQSGLGLPVTYGFYAACALISFFFVRALVHETRGRELEQMTG